MVSCGERPFFVPLFHSHPFLCLFICLIPHTLLSTLDLFTSRFDSLYYHTVSINSWSSSLIKENEFTRVCSLLLENAGPNEAELGARNHLDRYVLFSTQPVIIKCEIHDEETRALHRASTASTAITAPNIHRDKPATFYIILVYPPYSEALPISLRVH